jgi:site-specific DNA recombinase
MERGQRVALYGRVSTEAQAERQTIEAQRDYLRQYAVMNGLTIAGEFFDQAEHGPTPLAERPQGRRLIALARSKKIDKVLFFRVDRFARNLRDLLEVEAELSEIGVGLQSASEPFDTATPTGRFMFGLLGGIAELERHTILERSAAGRVRRAKAGYWVGGPPPFGYAIEGGRLVPDPITGPIVQEVYQRLIGGSSLMVEFARLNGAGVTGRRGASWTEGRLSRLVRSTAYKGQVTLKSKAGPITLTIPPLVSPEEWQAALDQLRRNATTRPPKRFNLLRGKVRCLNCGGPYVASYRSARGQAYYRCLTGLRLTTRHCRSVNLNSVALEAWVLSECRWLMERPQMIMQNAADELEHLEELDANRAAEAARLRQAIEDQERAKQRIIRLVRQDRITDAEADAELDAINQEIGRLHGALSALDSAGSRASALARRLKAIQVKLVKLSRSVDLTTDAGKRELIEALVVGLDVETIGEGIERRVRLTLKLIAQDPLTVMDPAAPERTLDPETGFEVVPEDDEDGGVPIRRLSKALRAEALQNVARDHRDSRVQEKPAWLLASQPVDQ